MEISNRLSLSLVTESPFNEGSLRLLLQKYSPEVKGIPIDSEFHLPMPYDFFYINTAFDEAHLLGRGDLTIGLKGTLVGKHEDHSSESGVALKVFYPRSELIETPEDRSALLKQFYAEVKLLDSYHPNIGKFLGLYEIRFGNSESRFPAIAHEYFPTTLAELRHSGKIFLTDEIVALVTQIADATNFLYMKHRQVFMDIISGNIGARENGSFALMDVNLSVPDGEVLRQGNGYNLSEDVLPPEMVKATYDVTASPRLAVYNLGLLAYELFGGKRPTREEKISGDLNLPQLPALTPELNEVLRRATTKKPGDRYDTIVEFMNALNSVGV